MINVLVRWIDRWKFAYVSSFNNAYSICTASVPSRFLISSRFRATVIIVSTKVNKKKSSLGKSKTNFVLLPCQVSWWIAIRLQVGRRWDDHVVYALERRPQIRVGRPLRHISRPLQDLRNQDQHHPQHRHREQTRGIWWTEVTTVEQAARNLLRVRDRLIRTLRKRTKINEKATNGATLSIYRPKDLTDLPFATTLLKQLSTVEFLRGNTTTMSPLLLYAPNSEWLVIFCTQPHVITVATIDSKNVYYFCTNIGVFQSILNNFVIKCTYHESTSSMYTIGVKPCYC